MVKDEHTANIRPWELWAVIVSCIVTFFLLGFWLGQASAADYMVSTSSIQRESALAWRTIEYNKQKKIEDPAWVDWTQQQYLQAMVDEALDGVAQNLSAAALEVIDKEWPNFTPAQQADICAKWDQYGSKLPVCP